jgi:uncharacterized membrane protein YecN with MAPEG domain
MQVSMITAGLLGLLLVILSIRVTLIRRADGISVGDGGNAALNLRMRAQGNCTEYVPTGLLLLFLAEQGFGATWFVIALAATFVVGRVLHPIGMGLPAPNVPRVVGMVCTWTPMGLLAILVLMKGVAL